METVKNCRQGWIAYKYAYRYLNDRFYKEDTYSRCSLEKEAFDAYRVIILYERRRSALRSRTYMMAPDWDLFRLSYQDALTLFRKTAQGAYGFCPSREDLVFMGAFISLLKFARERKLGNINRYSLYRFTDRLFKVRREAIWPKSA